MTYRTEQVKLSPERCCKSVWVRDMIMRSFQCQRKWVVEREGKKYCKQHDPVEIAQKRKVREREFDRMMIARKEIRERPERLETLLKEVEIHLRSYCRIAKLPNKQIRALHRRVCGELGFEEPKYGHG